MSLGVVLLTPLLSFEQNEDNDTDYKTFFSVHAGLNGTRMFTENGVFSNSLKRNWIVDRDSI